VTDSVVGSAVASGAEVALGAEVAVGAGVAAAPPQATKIAIRIIKSIDTRPYFEVIPEYDMLFIAPLRIYPEHIY
jgi:hypothetical protein